eukprot:c10820_g1_i1 orf=3-245(-)
MSKKFFDFCEAKGIKRELSTPFNPPQNGVTDQINQTIQDQVQSMLSQAALPHGFWAEAIQIAVYIINWSPNRRLDRGQEDS